MKRMYSDGAQDLDFTSNPWAHTIDLINGAIGLRTVGATDINWSNGTTKFFYPKGGSGVNRFQGGMRVQPYVATGYWQDIKKADFDTFPAAGTPTELILDLSADDMVSIPNDVYRISSKSRSAESTLIMINQEAGDVIHKINYASTADINVGFDSIDFMDQIKDWYRQKGWVDEEGSIVIPSKYVHITATKVDVEDEALPPEVRIHYRDDPNNNIYVLPRTIVTPR